MVTEIKNKQFLRKIRLLALAIFIVISSAVLSFNWGLRKGKTILSSSGSLSQKVDLSLFWLVWDQLETKYLDKESLDQEKMVYGAISGMVSSLDDPYTVFLPPQENKLSKEDLSGAFGGVGIQLGYKDGTLAVISPLKGTPAEKSGVKAGDLILRIRDEEKKINRETKDVSLPEAVAYIRGKMGTKVYLTLLREGDKEPKETELTREKIVVPSLRLAWIEKNGVKIAHIQILSFSERLFTDWQKVVEEINSVGKTSNLKGMILDLRDNPGGYLQAAIDVASEFLESGIVVKQEGVGGIETFSVNKKGTLLNQPLVVLVNGGSASASEILAGALQEHKRAILIGEKTFGKGTIQEPEDLPGETGLHVTIARWLLPSGKNIHKEGIEPDLKVEMEDLKAGDLQLDKAVLEILNK